MREMSASEQEQWRDQNDGAPDVRVLWNKTPKAKRPHLCDQCHEEIAPGEVYESQGYIIDGEFTAKKTHRWAYHYPSGCPRFRHRDLTELQFQEKNNG